MSRRRLIVWLIGFAALGCAVLGLGVAVTHIRQAAHRGCVSGNFCQLQLAIHNYHDTHGKLPGPYRDAEGRPILSWRVAILPYMEEDPRFRKFRLDEPWDSPHNAALMNPMPILYRGCNRESTTDHTHIRAITGPGTAFERDGLTFADIKDGLAGTMLMADAAEAVPWSKPEELEFHPDRPLPSLGGRYRADWFQRRLGWNDGGMVLKGEGCSGAFFRRDTPEHVWRAMASRAGGESVPFRDYAQ